MHRICLCIGTLYVTTTTISHALIPRFLTPPCRSALIPSLVSCPSAEHTTSHTDSPVLCFVRHMFMTLCLPHSPVSPAHCHCLPSASFMLFTVAAYRHSAMPSATQARCAPAKFWTHATRETAGVVRLSSMHIIIVHAYRQQEVCSLCHQNASRYCTQYVLGMAANGDMTSRS